MKTVSTLWGLHAGKTGDAHTLFLQHHCIALGWAKVAHLSQLKADRESFKAAVKQAFHEMTDGAIATSAGQLFRFVHEMKLGDLVAYSSKVDRQIHLARVESPYVYSIEHQPSYPHRRKVKWLKTVPRTRFSQGALHEIGSAMSFFQIKNYADEYFALLEGKAASAPIEQDETVAFVADSIEENTQTFILKTLAKELKGHPFAEFVAHLMKTMGYNTRVSLPGPDGGVDIIAHKDELGFEPPIIKVQVKSTEGSIGDPVVSALYGKVSMGEYGLLVTLGSFTTQARNFAASKSNLRLVDGEELVELILNHYEQFDARYKGLLPLRRVYVPEPLDESEE
ncbi:MAG TPA: restriction endonuclease [Blastocatellia bacterium]|nr:restriction endonuclease [Blastocatellia bacterium]HMV82988.1 restriction endonuclease [Blastocatellia bacterium]HMX25851.1 restriction endonuclease [Blastocatellia bacterium]HMY72170.1 restriction endonuclease [Blastocatellia bacterium]HMZ19763.1 restriction endonuclease [Blastocatellia bacterium]